MQICRQCSEKVPLYLSTCRTCGAVVRDRVPNIDFWHTLWTIIVQPADTLKLVIQAEKKNFIFFILLFVSVKLFLNYQIFTIQIFHRDYFNRVNFLQGIGIIFIWFLLITGLGWLILRYIAVKVRFRDVIAIILYSQLPLCVSLLLLFTPEFVLFGPFLFSYLPSPFVIHTKIAIFLGLIETGALIWAVYLLYTGIHLIIEKKIHSSIIAISVSFFIHFLPVILIANINSIFRT